LISIWSHLLLGDFLDASELPVLSGVGDDVEPAEVAMGRNDGVEDAASIGHVHLDG